MPVLSNYIEAIGDIIAQMRSISEPLYMFVVKGFDCGGSSAWFNSE